MQSLLALLASHDQLAPYLTQLLRACVWLALLIAVFGPLERVFSVRPAAFFQKGWLVNLGWYFINSLTPIFLLGPPAVLLAWAVHAVLPTSFTGAANLPLWARMVAAMIVGEIGFYWGHRWSHEIPLLWRFHAVHHSATHVNFLVNTRAHPVDILFTRLCGLALLYARSRTTRTIIMRPCCRSWIGCLGLSTCQRLGPPTMGPRPRCRTRWSAKSWIPLRLTPPLAPPGQGFPVQVDRPALRGEPRCNELGAVKSPHVEAPDRRFA
jgi:Fatty acid hydroxylase superfamily